MKGGMKVYERVINWNAQRYDQEHVKALTTSLLREEVQEFSDAFEDVHMLNALCDLIYVSYGAMWKLGLNADQIERAIYAVCDSNDSKEIVKTIAARKANVFRGEAFAPPEPILTKILEERR